MQSLNPLDEIAPIFDQFRAFPQDLLCKIVESFEKEFVNQVNVLEVGVGTGLIAQSLQSKGFTVTGIDVSREMTCISSRKMLSHVAIANVCFLPFRKDTFDVAVSMRFLHLIDNWKRALNEICRVAPKLFSVFTVPSTNLLSRAYEQLANEKGYVAKHAGLKEGEFSQIVQPVVLRNLMSMTCSFDDRLAGLEHRVFSRQWKVPCDKDRVIVKNLVDQFSGKTYHVDYFMACWNSSDILAYLEKSDVRETPILRLRSNSRRRH